MKTKIIFFLSLIISFNVMSQGVGINSDGADPDASAMLDVVAVDKGVLIPRMTSAQRTGISNAVKGLLVFDNTTTSFWYYTGTVWQELVGSTSWIVSGNNQYSNVSGGIGVGTTNPNAKLHVLQNTNTASAMDISVGNPSLAAGPANTTSEFAALDISHMATGTSPTAGRTKSAITATNNSEDPTIFVQNLSAVGAGIEVYLTPTAAAGALSTAIYGRADRAPTNGYGVAIWGDGGNYGVIGGTSTNAASSNYGVLSLTNSGAFGTKSFHIDHPLDPANKTLTHYSIESNEILNMYRGIVELDENGFATVTLPDYFEARQ